MLASAGCGRPFPRGVGRRLLPERGQEAAGEICESLNVELPFSHPTMIAVACRVDVRFKSTFSSVESCLRSGAGLRDCGPVVVVRLPFLGFLPSLFCPTSDSKLEAQRRQVTRGENPPQLEC